MEKRASVIIPTYNCAGFIERAVKSVLNQTYKEIDIIVVDDGSIDNTKEILEPYLKNNIIRYFYQRNLGVSAARNKGLGLAKSEYVAFLDADDFWESTFIESMLFNKKKYKISVCDCSILYFEDKEKLIRRKHVIEKSENWEITFILKNHVDMIGTLSRCMFDLRYVRDNEIKFNEDLRYREDWDFLFSYISLLAPNEMHYVNKQLFSYAKHGKNTTSSIGLALMESNVKFLKKWKYLYRILNIEDAYSIHMWDLARKYYYHTHHKEKALSCILESVSFSCKPLLFSLKNKLRIYH